LPTFCRHNRLVQNCPICSREQEVEMRPIVSSGVPRVAEPRPRARKAPSDRPARAGGGAGVTVRRVRTSVDDGYRSPLVPGLKSSAEADRLAGELAFAAHRLAVLQSAPPGLYAEVAAAPDPEEAAWLAFLIAYLCPLDDPADPFAALREIRTSWASGELPELDSVAVGPRGAHDSGRGTATLAAYRAWAERAGSQQAAFTGDAGWAPQRRFARVYERMSLPGLNRGARFDLLVSHGRLGLTDLAPASLMLGGSDEVTVAAKRALGIGDPLLLDRRAAELARACGVPLEALDLGFFNWERGTRATMGLGPDAQPDLQLLDAVSSALGLPGADFEG